MKKIENVMGGGEGGWQDCIQLSLVLIDVLMAIS